MIEPLRNRKNVITENIQSGGKHRYVKVGRGGKSQRFINRSLKGFQGEKEKNKKTQKG